MERILVFFQNYQKQTLIFVVLSALIASGLYYYSSVGNQRQEQAHVALSETLHEFTMAMRDQATWDEVGLAAQTGYRKYKNTSLAPYFLSIEAEAAVHKGNIDEAKNIMDAVLKEIPASSPLYYPLKLKHTRLLLDNEQEEVVNQGFKELESLAYNATAKNTIQDAALYYLGSYYASRNDMLNAQKAWQVLIERFSGRKHGEASPWVELAQAYLG